MVLRNIMPVEKTDFIEFKPDINMPGYDPRTSPSIKLATVSNVWVKMMTFAKTGDYIPGHLHTFDHLTLLSKGSVEVLVNGQTSEFSAPALILITKDTKHQITALEPGTIISCIHALRGGDVSSDIISEDMLPKGTSPLGIITNYNLTPLVEPYQ